MSNKGLPFDTPNAGHSYKSTINEQYGTIDIKPPYPKPPMSGFALNEHSCNVMDCIDPSHMPVTETILKEFAVVDRYFAGFPGPTEVNRLFWHATTNGGYCDNPSDDVYVEGFKMESLLHRLEQQNISAKVRLTATLPHPQPVTHSLGLTSSACPPVRLLGDVRGTCGSSHQPRLASSFTLAHSRHTGVHGGRCEHNPVLPRPAHLEGAGEVPRHRPV